MSGKDSPAGPVKAWIEPDRWTFVRAQPLRAGLVIALALGSVVVGFAVHPSFFLLTALALLVHGVAEARLRELFRDGMLHPAVVVESARGLIATLVRLEQDGHAQDAVVISRIPRRWTRQLPPWGGARAAMVIAGNPPKLRPLSPDVAVRDPQRAQRATERIPDVQWHALSSALGQLESYGEGVYPVELGRAPWFGTVRALEVEGSLPEHLDGQAMHAWCAGLPLVERPQMVEAERAHVQRLKARAYRAAALIVLALVLLVAAAWASATSALGKALWVAAWSLSPLTLGWSALWLQRGRAYARDLQVGQLWRFVGAPSAFDSLGSNRDLARLARLGVFAPEPGVEQDLTVLAASHQLLHANGKWAPPSVRLHVSEIAAPPAEPAKLALPRELRTEQPGVLEVARRRLTQAELAELQQSAARLRKPRVTRWWLIPVTALVFCASTGGVMAPYWVAGVVLSLWEFVVKPWAQDWRLAARLREDVELGWVITVDHGHAVAHVDDQLPARGVESLLHARLDWTVNRRPAAWRRD